MTHYNYKLDTSNLMESENDFLARYYRIINAWNACTLHFLNIGKKVKIKYWFTDLLMGSEGYSSHGISQLIDCSKNYELNKSPDDDLYVLTIELTPEVKQLFLASMREIHDHITPFFHFDILNSLGESIYTSQDNGVNLLMYLEDEAFEKISQLNERMLFKLSED